ncbi:hypothetical protein GUJ93_ZPchr0011g28380 [Zizania palustris]|uniref:Uncharacterized protein n=1 Tax=Zizania palustris TaxID=103762 RepID=A0A8J5WKT6_ZIZPA|nr:hypothetical protein GUJ93_ZPchr0011g28380 [Zizania palustris]
MLRACRAEGQSDNGMAQCGCDRGAMTRGGGAMEGQHDAVVERRRRDDGPDMRRGGGGATRQGQRGDELRLAWRGDEGTTPVA